MDIFYIISNYFIGIVLTVTMIYTIKAIKEINAKKQFIVDEQDEFNNDFKKQMTALNKAILEYTILRKHYYEMFAKDLDKETSLNLAQLQIEQSKAIEVEDYEKAGELQKEINLLITGNETIKNTETDNL